MGKQGHKQNKYDLRTEIPYSKGGIAKTWPLDFDTMCTPVFGLSTDEKKAIALLRKQTNTTDDEKTGLLRQALEERHTMTLTANNERRFRLPRGMEGLYFALRLIGEFGDRFKITRYSSIAPINRMISFELGIPPTQHQIDFASRNFQEITINDFVDELATGFDYRYRIDGMSYVEWAVFWKSLYHRNLVRPMYGKGFWETFVNYFIEDSEAPYELYRAKESFGELALIVESKMSNKTVKLSHQCTIWKKISGFFFEKEPFPYHLIHSEYLGRRYPNFPGSFSTQQEKVFQSVAKYVEWRAAEHLHRATKRLSKNLEEEFSKYQAKKSQVSQSKYDEMRNYLVPKLKPEKQEEFVGKLKSINEKFKVKKSGSENRTPVLDYVKECLNMEPKTSKPLQHDAFRTPVLPRFTPQIWGQEDKEHKCIVCGVSSVDLCSRGHGVVDNQDLHWDRLALRDLLCEKHFVDFVDSELAHFRKWQKEQRWAFIGDNKEE